MIEYSVIVPVYRGEATIERLFFMIKKSMEEMGKSAEVIFVHDNGPDNSWNIICGLKERFPDQIKGVQLTRNFGQHNATICGFKYATGSFIITLDEDLQHNPADIRLLIDKQNKTGADIIYGVYQGLKHNYFRNITSIALKKILAIGIPDLHNDYTSFRMIKGSIAKQTLEMRNSYTFLDGYLAWITLNVSSVPVTHSLGEAGKSSYGIKKLLNHALNVFVTFSKLPIQLLLLLALLMFCSALFALIYFFVEKMLYDNTIPMQASVIIVLGLGFGIVIFGLAILAEYLQQINTKTTRRPVYLEKEVI